ncbi:MAG TPA: YajQ family cyclic di-GMP-binding protein [Polyangiaceae bacterium LLY-WYZ-14_1]|jgi:hypothetical protein|nr:YajQ family cyclic di-GMP-binding protein [Polyangiaceae bacterium LLY-WYZ-14_1]
MPTFDVVSKVDHAEVDNAVHQAHREISQRFDFKGTNASIERSEEGITLQASSADRVDAVRAVLVEKLTKRKVSPRVLDAGKMEPAAGGSFRQLVTIKEGLTSELAKQVVKEIKDAKMKVQASIQGDLVRVSGKKRDDLQAAIALLKEKEHDRPLQYVNFRD